MSFQRVVERERLRLLGRFFPVAVIRFVEVGDALGLAERFNQERIVSPSSAGIFAKPNAVYVEERLPVDGRPD